MAKVAGDLLQAGESEREGDPHRIKPMPRAKLAKEREREREHAFRKGFICVVEADRAVSKGQERAGNAQKTTPRSARAP